jgi:cobalt-zinc-cadmium efflux system membrane fusion protein
LPLSGSRYNVAGLCLTTMRYNKKTAIWAAAVMAVLAAAFVLTRAPPKISEPRQRKHAAAPTDVEIELTETQAAALTFEKVTEATFVQEKQAVGSIDFNQNRLVTVFTPYQGRIVNAALNIGDSVEKDQVLFTLDSPDLLTAESTLIAAAASSVLQSRTLGRTKSLLQIGGISQQQADQTISDQQSAEGSLKSARDAVRMFGKTPEEINKIILERKADPQLVVRSPIAGFVTARAAVPGLFVQPGVAPAPYTVADTSTMWMMANVFESDVPALSIGQEVTAKVAAYPGRVFSGKVTVLGPSVDPITRRVAVRSEISDPDHLLRAGMFASFTIRVGDPFRALAVSPSAVVREGDGTMVSWVTLDRLRFHRREVITGVRQGDFVQIVEGLKKDELIVNEGAVLLSNQVTIGIGTSK